MKQLALIIRVFVLSHWKVISATCALSLALIGINILPLAIIAAILHVLFGKLGTVAGQENASTIVHGPSTLPLNSLDIAVWNDYLAYNLDAAVNSLGTSTFVVLVGLLYIAVVFITKCGDLLMAYLLLKLRSQIAHDMIKNLFYHICNLSLDFFNKRRTGDLLSRMWNDTNNLSIEVHQLVFAFFSALPVVLFFWSILIITSVHLALAAVLVFAVSAALNQFIARRTRKAIVTANDALGDVGAKVSEVFSSMIVVKAFDSAERENRAVTEQIDRHFRYGFVIGFFKRLQASANGFFQAITTVIILIVGVYMVVDGSMTVSTLILYFAVMNKVQGATHELLDTFGKIQRARGYAERVFDIMSESSSVPEGHRNVDGFGNVIEFKNVSFSYAGTDAVLHDFNLTLRKGQTVAIVGHSGSGKSTLISLLLRFYDPQQGEILFDGMNIKVFRQASYRRLFGVVTQDPILFHETIRNNIAYAASDENVSDEAIERAAVLANAHDFILRFREGYETVIGDRGAQLSGGQRQRITLARAVLREPQIIVLDEATSALDSESEQQIQEALERYLVGRTALIVAHRLSTVRNADRIVVLDHGRIVGDGTHEELLKDSQIYSDLYRLQVTNGA